MLHRILQTREDPLLTLLRLCLGIVFFAHGAQKALGWWGGPGYSTTLSSFAGMGIPAALAALAILAEFLGGKSIQEEEHGLMIAQYGNDAGFHHTLHASCGFGSVTDNVSQAAIIGDRQPPALRENGIQRVHI